MGGFRISDLIVFNQFSKVLLQLLLRGFKHFLKNFLGVGYLFMSKSAGP